MERNNNKISNRFLRQARQRSDLQQKVISFLIGRKFTDDISRYESGLRTPNLETALKLEIIYRVPVRLLFFELFQKSLWQIRDRSEKYNDFFPKDRRIGESLSRRLNQEDYCVYAELLLTPNLPEIERQKIHEHIRNMMNTMNGAATNRGH